MAKSVCWHTSSDEVASWSHASRSKDHETRWGGAELVSLKFVLALLVRKEICWGNVSIAGGTGLAQRWYMWVKSFCLDETPPPPSTPELYVFSRSKKPTFDLFLFTLRWCYFRELVCVKLDELLALIKFYEVSSCCIGEGTYWVLPPNFAHLESHQCKSLMCFSEK